MKQFVFALVLLSSQFAFADHFGCTLKNGFESTERIAEYRVREASVFARPFTCTGQMKDGTTTVVLSSTETDNVSTVRVGLNGQTAKAELTGLDVHGDGIDTATCECGLR